MEQKRTYRLLSTENYFEQYTALVGLATPEAAPLLVQFQP